MNDTRKWMGPKFSHICLTVGEIRKENLNQENWPTGDRNQTCYVKGNYVYPLTAAIL